MKSCEATGDLSASIGARRRHPLALLAILAVYLVLAFYGIGRQSLWEDEFLSLARTESAIPIWKDGHGFLYFAALNAWAVLGTSEATLRSLSVLFGVVALVLTYAVGLRLVDRRTALIATSLAATSPFLIWYSQEARYITLMLAATLVAMYAFQRVVADPSFRWWVASGGALLLASFSFVSTLLLPLVQSLYLAQSPVRRTLLKPWIVCQISVAVVFLLWFINGTHFLRASLEARSEGEQIIGNSNVFPFSADYAHTRPAVIPYTFFTLSAGFSLGPSPRELYADRSLTPLAEHAPMLAILSVLYGGLLFAGLSALRRRPDSRLLLLLWLLIPVLGVFAIARLLNIFYDVRYAAMAFPAYIFIVAAGIAGARGRVVQCALVAAVLTVHASALANYYFDPRYAREDTRAAARFLHSRAEREDLVLVLGTLSSLPHYYRGASPLVSFSLTDAATESLVDRLHEQIDPHERIWLVQIRPWQIDRAGQVKTALDDTMAVVEERRFPGVEIYGYKKNEFRVRW